MKRQADVKKDTKLESEAMSRGNDPSLLKGQEQKILDKDIKKEDLKDKDFKDKEFKDKDLDMQRENILKQDLEGKKMDIKKDQDLKFQGKEGKII